VQDNKNSIDVRGQLLQFDQPIVMGILNTTPDSFYAKSRVSLDEVVDKAGIMLELGATILDIGGYSTRPGAVEVEEATELERVLPVIEALSVQLPQAILSVDTFRAQVAEASIKAGAHMINDVGGGTLDEVMFDTIARLKVPYILMHMRGTPQTMQHYTEYDHFLTDVLLDLAKKLQQLRTLGVADVIIDPGFGFAKTQEQNFELLNRLEILKDLDCPLLVGISRKGMIWKSLDIEPSEALNGTTVLNTMALLKGASILRVHDVKEAVEVVRLVQKTLA
jgi:dihydropteroate synthase